MGGKNWRALLLVVFVLFVLLSALPQGDGTASSVISPADQNWVSGFNGDTFDRVYAAHLGAKTGAVQLDRAEKDLNIRNGLGLKRLGTILTPQAYFPVIMDNHFFGIYGQVMDNGQPASGVALDLRFYDGANWSTHASTVTDAQGVFRFVGVPNLNINQYYYVRYLNSSDTSRLFAWHTPLIDQYLGEKLDVGTFHLDDIVLTSPSSGAYVSVPRTFTWQLRSGLVTDSYEFNLLDYDDGNPWFWTDPPLGYVGSYTLQSLPAGFSTDTYYIWTMWVYDDLGGVGIAYWARWVAFSNTGTGMVSRPIPSSALEKLEDLEMEMLPQPEPFER